MILNDVTIAVWFRTQHCQRYKPYIVNVSFWNTSHLLRMEKLYQAVNNQVLSFHYHHFSLRKSTAEHKPPAQLFRLLYEVVFSPSGPLRDRFRTFLPQWLLILRALCPALSHLLILWVISVALVCGLCHSYLWYFVAYFHKYECFLKLNYLRPGTLQLPLINITSARAVQNLWHASPDTPPLDMSDPLQS